MSDDDTAKTARGALPVRGFVLDDRYRLERPIGVGGNGQVWRGVQLSVDRPVAIKLLLPKHLKNEQERRRFEREARYACRLSHPNLVTYHEYGHDTDKNIAYIVMELLEGRTIGQELRRRGPMDVGRVCGIVDQVCSALAVAHAVGLIHRDIKPSNIMLLDSRTGQAGDLVKVIDFGLAKGFSDAPSHDTPLTKEGFVLGTPHYLAPEQIRGLQLDARTDLYSLACTVYRMLTGSPPFPGPDYFDVATRQVMEEPERMGDRYPGGRFPEPLEDLIGWSLAKDPDDRPESVGEFARRFRLCAEAASKPWLHHIELPPQLRKAKSRPDKAAPITFVRAARRQVITPPVGSDQPKQVESKQAETEQTKPEQKDPEDEGAVKSLTTRPGYSERAIATTPSMGAVELRKPTALVARPRWLVAGWVFVVTVSVGASVGCLALVLL